jgi:hypothetical protein
MCHPWQAALQPLFHPERTQGNVLPHAEVGTHGITLRARAYQLRIRRRKGIAYVIQTRLANVFMVFSKLRLFFAECQNANSID